MPVPGIANVSSVIRREQNNDFSETDSKNTRYSSFLSQLLRIVMFEKGHDIAGGIEPTKR